MIRSITEINIKRPLREVYDYLQVVNNYAAWQSGLTGVSATDGMMVGSLIRYSRTSEMGDGLVTTIKMTKNTPDHMESVTKEGAIKFHNYFDLVEFDKDRTIFRITVEAEIEPLPREAEIAVQFMTDERLREDLRRLKNLLEKES